MSKRRQSTSPKQPDAVPPKDRRHRRKSAQPTTPTVPPELTDASRGIRLQKAMAEAGVASRRDCEALITQGSVTVNAQPVTGLPAWVDPARDRIEVDGRPIGRQRRQRAPGQGLVYFMLNKPRRVISTTDDPEGRKHVLDLLPDAITRVHRLFPVGRLDADSTGLVLLTNDGELAHRLTHPSYEVPKQYRVSVVGQLTDADAARLREGLFLAERADHRGGGPTSRQPSGKTSGGAGKTSGGAGGTSRGPSGGAGGTSGGAGGARRARMAEVKITGHQQDRTRGDRTLLRVTLREGQNREIRRMMAKLGYKVRRLERLAIGPLTLSGLARGGYRPLRSGEITKLRKAASLETHFRR